ncbi:MAG: acetoin utilization protein AcuC [Gammaproteobacteria bacterium]|nr:acetoin utilization protein AcuC [Gammaproteobacteria bacterium]
MRVRVYGGAALAAYGFGPTHPFGCDRFAAFWQALQSQGLEPKIDVGTPTMCTADDLALFHTASYIERVRQQSITGQGYLDYGDTPAFPGVFEAASTVVGSVLDGLHHILEGQCRRVFVPIAGLHHARRDSAAGFCVFNDIGVLIEALRRRHGIQRLAYVDIDAHHGDGVFYAYETDPDLVFADIHEDGRYLYPGTGRADEDGKEKAQGTKLNIPLAPGADDALFQQVWPQVEEFIRAAKPEFIILQAGADSIAGDPITHMRFTPAAHAYATARLCALADEFSHGRIIALGGGGYDRANLAAAWTGVVQAMLVA